VFDALRLEAALQRWEPWLQSVQTARHSLEFQPDFTEQELSKWEKKVGWHTVWSRAREELDALVLPRTFAPYWVACFSSNYEPSKPKTYYNIKLPQRVRHEIFMEGIPGSVLIFFQGSIAWRPTIEEGEMRMKLDIESDGERVLPPFPLEFAVPSPIGLPISIGEQKTYDVLPILPPLWTVSVEHWPRPELAPPDLSPYITIRIPLFALGYGKALFRQLNKQLIAIAEWMMNSKMHPLYGLMHRGPSPSYYREWAIEEIDRATDKAKAFNQVCDILLVVEKEKEKKRQQVGRGRAGRRHDFVERSDEVMRATVRRRVQKWLKQAGIRLR
jgi:hypothetical protein